MKILVEFFIE